MCKANLKETRKMVMAKAHAMCREMKEQGLVFNYHTQLGLNIKYLWETIGEVIDTKEEVHDEEPISENITTDDEEIIEEDKLAPIEYVSHVALKDNTGYSFLFKMDLGDKVVEFTAIAGKNHKYPIVFDACPNDLELLDEVKQIINEKTGIYNNLETDVAEYRYHRGEDLFIYYDEENEMFKGYYCGNDVYGGRAFVFDIKDQQGPCSRSFRQLIKDHKANNFGAYTTMNGKGVTITKWKERILQECRKIYKISKNQHKVDAALALALKPWKADLMTFNAAIRLLSKLEVEYDFKYESYDAAVDFELRHIAEVRAKGNTRYGKDTQERFQDRIHQLGLASLYLVPTDKKAVNTSDDEFADVVL